MFSVDECDFVLALLEFVVESDVELLKNWSRDDTTKKASTFDSEDLSEFLVNAPRDRDNIWKKAGSCELFSLFRCDAMNEIMI